MRRDYHNWQSERVGRQMELLAYGQAGAPLLVFPSWGGRFFDYENAGMIGELTGKIDAGQLQVFCVDGIDAASWQNKSIHPHERVTRQVAYEEYVLAEVVPLIKGRSGMPQLSTTGCGMGAYQALNFALRHPDAAAGCVAMSGTFDRKPQMDGYFDTDFYFNNPVEYLPNTGDPWFLERYRGMRFVLAAGADDSTLSESYRMSEIFNRQGMPHAMEVWPAEEGSEWALWRNMARKYL